MCDMQPSKRHPPRQRLSAHLWLKLANNILWTKAEGWKDTHLGIHVDEGHSKRRQICIVLVADKRVVMSQSTEQLKQVAKDFFEEAEGWDLAPQPASLWWPSVYAGEDQGGHDDGHRKRKT